MALGGMKGQGPLPSPSPGEVFCGRRALGLRVRWSRLRLREETRLQVKRVTGISDNPNPVRSEGDNAMTPLG